MKKKINHILNNTDIDDNHTYILPNEDEHIMITLYPPHEKGPEIMIALAIKLSG